MKLTKTTTILLIAGVFTVAIVAVWAANEWTQQFGWGSDVDTSFSVWTTSTGSIPTNITLSLGETPADPTTIMYYIQNDGTVDIIVTGTVTFTEGSATVGWNPIVGYVYVPVDVTRQPITLTLETFIGDKGAGTVTFTSEEAP